ncbi:MAG: helix-turn-helix domain-containing protein [Actinobacteria bacterium]|nr:helix-turn-helix domain-containing protein [Actinomycetota bacterium]
MEDIPRHNTRFDGYREQFSHEPWPITVRTTNPVTFASAFASRNLGGYGIATAVCSAHTLETSGNGTGTGTGAGRGLQMVHIQLAGETRFTQHDHTAVLRPGDMSVYSLDSPCLTENLGTEALTFLAPAQELGLPSSTLEDLSGVALDRGRPIVQLVQPFARQLVGSLNSIDEAVGSRVVRGMIDLVSAALAETTMETAAGSDSGDGLLASILEYIDSHLHRPGLTVTEIAAKHFVSPRKLHALFETHETTAAAWIRARRLENCKRDLADSALADLRIAEIAARWGYTDAARFSRQFAHHFGVTPRTYRSGRAGF